MSAGRIASGLRPLPAADRAALTAFVACVDTDDVAADAAAESKLPYDRLRVLLKVFANEVLIGYEFVQPMLRPGSRVLEVGAGVGILASFLKSRGVAISGIEPGAAGYGYMPAIAGAVARRLGNDRFDPLPIGAGDLDLRQHGTFDLIYSIHVMEHILELDAAFRALVGVLAPSGHMVHMCPNYDVPYDPHLGIPLVPGFPRATRHLFPTLIRDNHEVWDGLNFLTVRDARRLARRNGLKVSFDRGIMSAYVRRIETDAAFSDRQAGAVVKLARVLCKSGVVRLIDRWPVALSSPMVMRFTLAKK